MADWNLGVGQEGKVKRGKGLWLWEGTLKSSELLEDQLKPQSHRKKKKMLSAHEWPPGWWHLEMSSYFLLVTWRVLPTQGCCVTPSDMG